MVCPPSASLSVFLSILLCLPILLTLSPTYVLGLHYSSRKLSSQYHDFLLFLIPVRINYCKLSLCNYRLPGFPYLFSPLCYKPSIFLWEDTISETIEFYTVLIRNYYIIYSTDICFVSVFRFLTNSCQSL